MANDQVTEYIVLTIIGIIEITVVLCVIEAVLFLIDPMFIYLQWVLLHGWDVL